LSKALKVGGKIVSIYSREYRQPPVGARREEGVMIKEHELDDLVKASVEKRVSAWADPIRRAAVEVQNPVRFRFGISG
jgi:hypothetical protein